MSFQVTMDRTISDADFDRLIQSNYKRRKFSTKFTEESNDDFANQTKAQIRWMEENTEGRWRMVRWIPLQEEADLRDPVRVKKGYLETTDPLQLEGSPNNEYPIVAASYCYALKHENNMLDDMLPDGLETNAGSWQEDVQSDWIAAGNNGHWKTNCGMLQFGLYSNGLMEDGEKFSLLGLRFCFDPHTKGKVIADTNRISLMPMVEYFQTIGVTHWGQTVKGSLQKKFVQDWFTGTTNVITAEEQKTNNHIQTISGNTRLTHPNNFPYKWAYNWSNNDDNENVMFNPIGLACEDQTPDGIGWPNS